jgi:alkylation response protein AidB-like acyl-CoA dehydrogenase
VTGLTDEERAIRAAILDFVEREIRPGSAERERTGQFPREQFRELGRQGYLGMAVPERLGGAGASYLAQTLVVEAIAYGCPALAVVYEVHNSLHLEAVWRYGTSAQHAAWLPPLIAGDWLGAFALTEPEAGSNAAAITTTGERVADGYRLTGQKVFITSAGVAERYLVFGRLPGTAGREGVTAWVVPADAPGLSWGPAEEKMGLHQSRTASLRLDGVVVPEDHRLGAEGDGYGMAMALLDGGRIGIAAQACGMLAAALARSLDYAKTRRQFGQTIDRFELVRAKLADMATDLRAARFLTYDAARVRDLPAVRVRAAMAKLFASEKAVRHALAAVQIHGGYGYMREYGVERLVRDAKVTEIYEGTSEILRLLLGAQIVEAGPAWALEL